ncbi:MAG: FAD:protein FMN transferase [Chloroflexota bacterium]
MTIARGRLEVEQIMGTAIGIDLRDDFVGADAMAAAFASLRAADAQFSTYRPDSEVSRLGRSELALAECRLELRRVLSLAEQLRADSGGHFDIYHHRSDGGLDPSGVVKGWAVEEAAWILDAAGARNYAINAGGDILVRGEPEPGEPWRIGVRHPRDADAVAHVLELRGGAIATSGAYERGDHIRSPMAGTVAQELLSLTVVGPSLTLADAYATAGFAMGTDGLTWVDRHDGYRGYGMVADNANAVHWIEMEPARQSL